MKVKESSLWKWLANLRLTEPALWIGRIENTAGKGIPDVIGCYKGKTFFIELKTCNLPKRHTSHPGFTVEDSQREWHEDWQMSGGTSWFLIQMGKDRYLLRPDIALSPDLTVGNVRRYTAVPPQCTQLHILRVVTNNV